MHLDADEPVLRDHLSDHLAHASTVAGRMHKGKAVETVGTAGDDPPHLVVGDRIIGVKRGENHGAVDARARGSQHVLLERGGRVPWPGQPVALPRMAVAIDDHGDIAACCRALTCPKTGGDLCCASCEDAPLAISSRKAILVATPLKKVGRWIFSSGPCRWSSGKAKPMRTVGMPSLSFNRLTTGMVPPQRRNVGATPKPRRYACAAARIAGWRRSSTAGLAARSVRTATRTAGGAIRRTWARNRRSISCGSWSGASRILILAEARAGMTALTPWPW